MNQNLIVKLIEANTPAALVAEVAMELAKASAALQAIEERRAKDRERKRIDALPRNSTESSEIQEGSGQKENPPNPLKKNTPLRTPKGVTPQAGNRPSRLPDDFEVPEDWIEWAMEKRQWAKADAVEEAECFCRYWQAKADGAAKRSWKKTWQNWVVNSRRARSGTGPAAPGYLADVARRHERRAA